MISAEGVTRTYGDVVAVNSVSFQIQPGEIVGLLGQNGAGKTTIMKMITGYLEPSGGSIKVDGFDASSRRLKVQGQIGYLPENCPLYPEMNVLDYLDYAASLRGVSADQKMARIGYAVDKTNLIDVAQKQVNTLSRGYRQRLGVAQAILNSPRILILDEPTNGLDPSQILEMRSLIRELAQSATVVISTHILQEVQAVCGRVIIINSGQLAIDAKISDLQATARIFVAIDKEREEFSQFLERYQHINQHIQLINYQKRGYENCYTLEIEGEKISEAIPRLARSLVEFGCNIYSIQPIVRDLETIFREITQGKNGAISSPIGDDGDGHG